MIIFSAITFLKIDQCAHNGLPETVGSLQCFDTGGVNVTNCRRSGCGANLIATQWLHKWTFLVVKKNPKRF